MNTFKKKSIRPCIEVFPFSRSYGITWFKLVLRLCLFWSVTCGSAAAQTIANALLSQPFSESQRTTAEFLIKVCDLNSTAPQFLEGTTDTCKAIYESDSVDDYL